MKNNNMNNEKLGAAAVKMIRGWLAKGDSVEGVAYFMAYTLRVGTIGECREFVFQALDDEAMPAEPVPFHKSGVTCAEAETLEKMIEADVVSWPAGN